DVVTEYPVVTEHPVAAPRRPVPGDKRGRPDTATRSLLLAASKLESPFTPSQLAVQAWKLDPSRFGLRGFEALYPDSNLVMAYPCRGRGLISRCFIQRTARGQYALTRGGWWQIQ